MSYIDRIKPVGDFLPKHKQPYFRVYYGNPKIEITEHIVSAILDEQASLMTNLTLSSRGAYDLFKIIDRGGIITFYGGDTAESGRINYRKVFQGRIRHIKSDYEDTGHVLATIICLEAMTLATTYQPRSHAYPDVSGNVRPSVRDNLNERYFKKVAGTEILALDEDKIISEWVDSFPLVLTQRSAKREISQVSKESVAIGAGDFALESDILARAYAKYIFMTYTDIVTGIAEENGWVWDEESIVIDSKIEKNPGKLPNLINQLRQDSQSDWSFLQKICGILEARCWLEPVVGSDDLKLFFYTLGEDNSHIKETALYPSSSGHTDTNLKFFYPLRHGAKFIDGGGRRNDANKGLKIEANRFHYDKESPYRFGDHITHGFVQIRDVTVSEDIGLLDAINPMASNSEGKDQGKEYRTIVRANQAYVSTQSKIAEDLRANYDAKEVLTTEKEGQWLAIPENLVERTADGKIKKTFTASELDIPESEIYLKERNYVVAIDDKSMESYTEEELDDIWGKVKENKDNLFKEEFNLIKFIPLPVDKESRVARRNWRGVRISANCDGNVNIRSQRFYEVHGIIRYGSDTDKERFFLRAMKHSWDGNGFSTNLEFFK